MPPLKLPKKGKGKQVHIDYATPDSARASAPSTWTGDDWFDEGTHQEEQGERYQAGPKATRHLNNAITCYALATQASPASFDARYNAARVWHTLATEHLPPVASHDALHKVLDGYREALDTLGPPGGDSDVATARIDALFNLAQARTALFDLVGEAVIPVAGDSASQAVTAAEARNLFVLVERLQREEMARFFGAGGPAAAGAQDGEGDESVDDAASSGTGGAGAETSVRAMESTIVTPRLVIDTLLESLRFDLALCDSSDWPPESLDELRRDALDTFARATALREAVLGEAADLDFELAFAKATLLTTLSPDDATPFIDQLASAHPAKVDLLSLAADHLVETLPVFSTSLPALLATLSTALAAYESAQSLLSSRLSPPRDIPASHLPALLSANLVAQSTVHLLAAELLSRAPADAPTDAAHSTPAAHLAQAHALALAATAAPRSGLSLVVASSAPAPSSSPASKPALALARAPASTDPRTHTRTIVALRGALFALSRVRLRLDPSPAGVHSERAQFWALWRALGLGAGRGVDRGSEGEGTVREGDAKWWTGEIEGDKVCEVMGEEAARAEMEYWTKLHEA
ncbi:hypothetical protein DMC30DRAFT_222403 [Rhodotorula diobovata]|uniref:Uncharacterized protein n=1 Tax=Rhodotorula diobovata TaxID=5288 RepID=A0A5C5FXF0_9BASI|nr:hypothetical protein DMC30DRAFT_222403 [Rhodotorula diobovata]